MDFFACDKSVLENLYLASGPILAILGFVIFYQIVFTKKSVKLLEHQIKQAKKHLVTISKRDSASIAAKRVDFFVENILPMYNKVNNERIKLKTPKFDGEFKEFEMDERKDWDTSLDKAIIDLIKTNNFEAFGLDLINYLEGFSVYFIKEIADEKIAFSSIGATYCAIVEANYPYIALFRNKEKANNHYTNLIALYKLWKERISKFELENKISSLKKEIENIPKNKGKDAIGTV